MLGCLSGVRVHCVMNEWREWICLHCVMSVWVVWVNVFTMCDECLSGVNVCVYILWWVLLCVIRVYMSQLPSVCSHLRGCVEIRQQCPDLGYGVHGQTREDNTVLNIHRIHLHSHLVWRYFSFHPTCEGLYSNRFEIDECLCVSDSWCVL